MACPFFMPTARLEDGGWLHASRLPLGGGWAGCCQAPGHEGVIPADSELHEMCNLGYAMACPRLPIERPWDAVRFAVASDRLGKIQMWYVCEFAHRPGEHGKLEYDLEQQFWELPHADARVQKMADCYLQSYLTKRNRSVNAGQVQQES